MVVDDCGVPVVVPVLSIVVVVEPSVELEVEGRSGVETAGVGLEQAAAASTRTARTANRADDRRERFRVLGIHLFKRRPINC
jgi:hypothetical protein